MQHRASSRGRSWVAILAAYLLVVQALFDGFAAGSYANALSLDRTLALTHCAPSWDGAPGGEHDKAQNHAGMSCCTAGCPMLAGADPVQSDFQIFSQWPADFVAFARRLDQPVGFISDRSSGNPRAPPALV